MEKVFICLGASFLLAGCGVVKDSLTHYEMPTEGAMARMRFIGFDPVVYSSTCRDMNAKPAGHLVVMGHPGVHDIGMIETGAHDKDALEARIPAGRPVTVEFGVPPPPPAPPGTYYRPGPVCPFGDMVRTFTPMPDREYEARVSYIGRCGILQISAIDASSGSIKKTPVGLTATVRCPEPQEK
jgi:hypothetical protein